MESFNKFPFGKYLIIHVIQFLAFALDDGILTQNQIHSKGQKFFLWQDSFQRVVWRRLWFSARHDRCKRRWSRRSPGGSRSHGWNITPPSFDYDMKMLSLTVRTDMKRSPLSKVSAPFSDRDERGGAVFLFINLRGALKTNAFLEIRGRVPEGRHGHHPLLIISPFESRFLMLVWSQASLGWLSAGRATSIEMDTRTLRYAALTTHNSCT